MMNAKCGQCGTEIRLDESKLGERGARVRCPRCSSTVVIEREPKGPDLLDIDFGSGLVPQVVDASAFEATAVDAPKLDRSPSRHVAGSKPGPGGARGAAPAPARAMAPPAPVDEPELLGDEDLELADADEVTDVADAPSRSAPSPARGPSSPGRVPPAVAPAASVPKPVAVGSPPSRPLAASPPPAPRPDPGRADTRVAPPPNLARPAAVPAALADRPPSALGALESTATGIPDLDAPDDSLMMNGALSLDGSVVRAPAPKAPAPPPASAPPMAVTRPVALADGAGDSVTTKARISDMGRPEATAVAAPPRSALRTIAAVAGALAAVALLFFGLIVFLSGGRIDQRVLRLDHEALAALWTSRPIIALEGVKVTTMRSFFYPIRTGEQALVFAGEVKNAGAEPRQRLQITAEVRDQAGRLLASASAPVGVALTPPELWASDDAAALARAYRPAAAASAPDTVPPSATAPFTVVIAHPPPQAEHQKLAVVLGYADPPKVEAPPPAAAPSEPAPPPTKGKGKGKVKPPRP
jgi:predicted Zn finger-like uncharacterized protein